MDPGIMATLTGNAPAARIIELTPRKNERPELQGLTKSQEKQKAPVDPEVLQKAVEQLQTAAQLVYVSLSFKVDTDNNKVQVIVKNQDTGEVIREIPPSDVIKAASQMQDLVGILMDAKV
jgi:flagellar protein FlaG